MISFFRSILYTGLLVLTLASCTSTHNEDADLPAVRLDIRRTELDVRAAASAVQKDGKLKPAELYRRYFAANHPFYAELIYKTRDSVPDSLVAIPLAEFCKNAHSVALVDTVIKYFPAGYPFDTLFLKPFRRLKKYFPTHPLPKIRTYVMGYPPRGEEPEPYFLSARYLGLGLDYCLGPNFPLYPEIVPKYVRYRYRPEALLPNVLLEFATQLQPTPDYRQHPTLVDRMVQEGIKLYFLDCILPHTADSLKLNYTRQQMAFVQGFTPQVYNLLLPLLYEQDYFKYQHYIADEPTTPGLVAQSPGRVGIYIGWQVVRKYMGEHPEVTLEALMGRRDYATIFKEAGYKP